MFDFIFFFIFFLHHCVSIYSTQQKNDLYHFLEWLWLRQEEGGASTKLVISILILIRVDPKLP